MDKNYTHLTQEERVKIDLSLRKGLSLRKIAEILGRSPSTIARELKRNTRYPPASYLPETAQHLYCRRRNAPKPKLERKESQWLRNHIEAQIRCGWSPQAIAGRLKTEHGRAIISHESIYDWIYNAGKSRGLYRYLIRKKRKRGFRPSRKFNRKNLIPDRIPIHERPVEAKTDFGHWEADLIILKQNKGAILTMVEKQSRFTIAKLLPTKETDTVKNAMNEALSSMKNCVKTITLDNGTENVKHKKLAHSLECKTYFCDPYASWQKGQIENVNGIIRRFIPKKTAYDEMSDGALDNIMNNINNMPRKSLGFKTALEAFEEYAYN